MSFSGEAFDKKEHNYKPKCFYLINLIKTKNPKVYARLHKKFETVLPEDSFDFYQLLLKEYKQLQDNNWKEMGPVKPEKPVEFHVVQYINPERQAEKKEMLKEEMEKEKLEKKMHKVEKPVKKVAVKKVVKAKTTTVKKKVAKKAVKKTVKKKVAKKAPAKKKVAKKKVAKKK
ncbi:MAG: hypothetical protein JNM93_03010 [Bacteriovoracaceae bacterium]|nr:hypothetical protein [Bacteriovoracaceae bacterium]